MTHSLSCPIRSPFSSGNFSCSCVLIYRKRFYVSYFSTSCFVTSLKCIFWLKTLLLRRDHLSTCNNTRFQMPVRTFRIRFDYHSPFEIFCPSSSFSQKWSFFFFLKNKQKKPLLLLCGLFRPTGWRHKWIMKSVKPHIYFCFRRTGLWGHSVHCFVVLTLNLTSDFLLVFVTT